MKKIYSLLSSLILSSLVFCIAQTSGTVSKEASMGFAERGDSAYEKDNFVAAEQFYLRAIKEEGSSPAIFYNLGNAYYRQGNLGKAVVNYERALKLDPTDDDARTNLEFVQEKLTDKQLDDGSVMTNLWNNILAWFGADSWAWISILLFSVFIACAATYLFSSIISVRKFSFFGGIIVFFLTLGAVLVSFAAANRAQSSDYAIILPPSSQLSTSPREARSQSEQAFLLHEGSKVLVLDSINTAAEGKWYEVRVGARERAWIKASEVEKI